MEYRLPTLEERETLQDYLRECRNNNERNALLDQELFEKDYPAWVGRIGCNSREGNGDWGRSLLLLCSDGDEAVGILCIRYELSDDLEAKQCITMMSGCESGALPRRCPRAIGQEPSYDSNKTRGGSR